MAVNIITPSNSTGTQVADFDRAAYLFVAEGAYISEIRLGSPAYFAPGGDVRAVINGTVIATGGIGAVFIGRNRGVVNGGNQVTIGEHGLVQGDAAVAVFGGTNSVTNHGMLVGSGTTLDRLDPDRRPAGVFLSGGASTLINDGDISGLYGVYSEGAGNKITNAGSITARGSSAIYAVGSTTVGNSGTIGGDVVVQGAGRVTNTGTIDGSLDLGDLSRVVNHGVITGDVYSSGDQLTVTNHGSIDDVFLGSGLDAVYNRAGATIATIASGGPGGDATGDQVLNEGTIVTVSLGTGDEQLENYGRITGNVSLSDGVNAVFNHGVIDRALSVGKDNDTIVNLGTIYVIADNGGDNTVVNGESGVINQLLWLGQGVAPGIDKVINHGVIGFDLALIDLIAVKTGEAADFVENTGTIHGGIEMGTAAAADDVDTLTNSGRITGAIAMGAGDDVVDTALGQIDGVVDLGAGNDRYTGGAGVDRVIGGAGVDLVDLGAGDDVYRAFDNDGADEVDGGAGTDTYNGSAVTGAFSVDLAVGGTGGKVGADTISGFENIVGGASGDTLTGSDDANRIDGGAGADRIDGGAGNDRLTGGAGADRITGGAGRDVMTGGALGGSTDADLFVFAPGDTGRTAATRDIITDFTDHGPRGATGADTIDLSAIDADTTRSGNQAFAFNATAGAAFSGTAGSLIWEQRDGYAIIFGDVDGDKVADFAIQLRGNHALQATDFVL